MKTIHSSRATLRTRVVRFVLMLGTVLIPTVDEGTGIARVVQYLDDATVVQFAPKQIAFADATADAQREGKPLALKSSDDGARATDLPETVEDHLDTGPDLLVRIEHHRTGGVIYQARSAASSATLRAGLYYAVRRSSAP